MPISCPAAATAFISAGNVSIEWPGMNHVVLMPSRPNSFKRRGLPTSPANSPREISSGESSPPYEPSQPATASTSTPNPQRISLAINFSLSASPLRRVRAILGTGGILPQFIAGDPQWQMALLCHENIELTSDPIAATDSGYQCHYRRFVELASCVRAATDRRPKRPDWRR